MGSAGEKEKFKKISPFWQILLIFIFFIPFFGNPIDINIHCDNAIELLDIIRLADARFSFSLAPEAIYANPFFQILSNDHGIMRPILLFPTFFFIDLIKIPLNEPTVMAIYIMTGFAMAAGCFLFLRKIFGNKKAFAFFALLCSIPFIMMQIKFGWWNFYAWLPFIAGFYFLDSFLKSGKKTSFIFFSLIASAYILATPGFIFGWLFYIIYSLIFLRTSSSDGKDFFKKILNFFKNPWTYLPLAVIAAEIIAILIAKKFGYGFGSMLKLLSKEGAPSSYGLKTVLSFLLENFGLTGFILFPAIIAAYIRSIFIFKKADVYLKTFTVFFTVCFLLLIFAAMGSGAYSYELYFSGLMMLVYFFAAVKNKFFRYAAILIILAAGWAQGLLYNFNYQPKNFLADEKYFIQRDNNIPDACLTIWCPYHFADKRNIGLKTLGFVARNYLRVSPLPYVSKQKNFEDWPKEFFFYSRFYQAPTIHLGRRLNDKLEYLPEAKIIAIYTPELLEDYPLAADKEKNQKISDFIKAQPRYKLAATITISGRPVIKVYELDGEKAEKIFPVEIYDQEFDKLYSNLKNLSHIDLGTI